ncbi:MAG: acetyl-CoA carboxylase biotin carboxylase subunit family protein [Pseudodesulfovibrio sp.]|uniref:biotin carboxylase n=1 Tax=Pseudodesulfovibrio aespoeensis (strain ATCC 700646 / DSM 10631 / Aspo-2) TaxID=643562 RepID=E6VW21_PSEA9|nr:MULTISPECIES: acetyl-CoA carboxylase biotin carboxylase subunit family protein [Pseudodesulfovibrio]MBU4378987.1 acetyl-CoA carboxylase biotin carboxylase subunit family protein [Pseudomonadota bacterium]MCG2734007.1 acetyl-CoA carboxylase biotin carboxylase subunit family protein [Pseudodesulfovibrio aespoeensis]ADU62466.1 Pyruvate carboxylase [Pseudodesulfovibrio aespoeensis Aspo-2]MBU4474563.1 acetyl-CoA carboxylase biotin carboxylase subunit family protein [Pseudomonadota bacterium]MBU4
MSIQGNKVLIANRGEIAVRIMQACAELGLDFVALYTREDEHSGHVDMARKLGGQGSLFRIQNYLDAGDILSVADQAKATAIHPGYGFFSENYRFARRVSERDRPMAFIGPSWRVIRDLGDKINTKRLARSLGVPTVPGSDRAIYDEMEAEAIAESLFEFQANMGIKRPVVLVKASAGGGGMGIDVVEDMARFRQTYRRIRNYSLRTFSDEGVLIEQRVFNFNHLEVQIVSDRSGKNPVHFGTRNCSVQSPGLQKRIEIAPGFRPENLRYEFDAAKVIDDITGYSLSIAREIKYDNVGTWEWIVTPDGKPFLMEVNTRIQVENGVSADISSIRGDSNVNLVREQIRLGLGESQGYSQKDISFDGVSIEYRIIAEDTENGFAPWVGRIDELRWTPRDWLSLHTHIPLDRPYQIPTEYDPNLALAIIWGKDLDEAKRRGLEFLADLKLGGVDSGGGVMKSNIPFLLDRTENLLEF